MNRTTDVSCLISGSPFRLMTVPFPGLSEQLAALFEEFERAFEYYSSLSSSLQSQYAILEPGETKPDLGFKERDPKDGKDDKIIFQYNHELWELLFPHLRTLEMRRFCDAASVLYDLALARMLEVVQALDEALDGRFDLFSQSRSHLNHKLRLNRYRGRSGKLAGDHYDKSFLTGHLGESQPGFIVKVEGGYHPVVNQPDTMTVFPGLKAPTATAGRIPLPLYHGATADTALAEPRMVIAFFLHGPWELYTRETHVELSGM